MKKTDAPRLVPAPVARAVYLGGISEVTEWRWRRDLPDFPKAVRIARRNFYKTDELEQFIAAHQVDPAFEPA